ncbi:MAG TPA: hypothetical protein VNI77_09490 [Nitrososphaera sp.]|nr:hypothetical protein [Nitrososphaera sp.]
MWISCSLSWYKLFASEKHGVVIVFVLCVMLRTVPELAAYPHPIGYDVINYYIPVVENLEEEWPTVANQFPLYVLFLDLVQLATGIGAHSVVTGVAIAMFGAFGASLYFLGRSLLRLGVIESVFLAIFAVFTMAVLRTAWDLHRDIFALTTMMCVFALLSKNKGLRETILVLALAGITVAADRMIGALLCISLIMYAVITRRKDSSVVSAFATGVFVILFLVSYSSLTSTNVSGNNVGAPPDETVSFYNAQNLLILFAVANGLLVAPAVIGFLRTNDWLLKVPLLVSLAGAFSWLVFPTAIQLVADRWTIVAGIFLAIFAGYGILYIIRDLRRRVAVMASCSILLVFAAIGMAYAVMPYDSPFVLYGIARQSIENFSPVTMQFNSVDIRENDEILSSIKWINQNTEHDAVIVGEKHW